MDWTPDICIYHDPCDDGFAAAWCVWKKWGDAVDFRPTNYGLPVPDHDISDKNILIVDFSFKPEIIEPMAELAKSIVILDHHKTAKDDLSALHGIVGAQHDNVIRTFVRMSGTWREKVLAEFDMERSGARMAWRFCHPKEPMPDLIAHIEDRDLWRFNLSKTKLLTLYLRSFDRDFALWDDLMDQWQSNSGQVLIEANAVKRFYDKKISEIVPTATLKNIGGFEGVPVASAPYAFVSELAHELLVAFPDAPFAAVAVDAYGDRTYSLRSEDGRQDVSEVAKKFGGGGHRNAAGFRVPV